MANTVFSSKDFKSEQLANFYQGIPQIEEKKQIIRNWQKAIENGKVHKSKEEQIKGEFLDNFFGKILGYSYQVQEAEWNIEKEFKSISDGKKPDAALGFFDQQGKQDVRCVIEVKGALVNLDKKQNRADFSGSSIDQAFNYVPRMPGKCEWVIVTNMIEIRLYSRIDISRYETFLIQELLLPDNLQRFFFLLSHTQLFLEHGQSRIDQLFANRQAEQKKIGAEFYRQYKDIRLILFANLFKENPSVKPKELFRGTQKLIDRLIFIGFVRDLRLVDNVLTELNQNIKTSFRKDNQKGWGELKELFNALNEGYSERNIPPFNGELFKSDPLLDNLVVRDHQIMRLVKLVQDYDFQSQLDVSILGHIFEQSIADLPEILDEIQKKTPLELEELKSETVTVTKRKKDGIFYTPEYITQYMVREAVGGWLEDRKQEVLENLKLTELPEPEFADYATIKIINDAVEANEIILLNLKFWRAYEEKLASIKVVDPACGSGAFLNQVFDFLFNEWAKVVRPELKRLTTPLEKQMLENSTVNEPLAFTYSGGEEWQLKKSIILNNIYGVDLNGESVEITKLSLWLKTANKTNSLAALYDNIKQGNSLIDDPAVAGDDAFDWNKAFPEIMKSGGFDVVVGNPPYVRQELIEREHTKHFEVVYSIYSSSLDLFGFFYERTHQILKAKGYVSFVSNSFSKTSSATSLRKFIQEKFAIQVVIDFNQLQVFEGATTYPVIIILKKENPKRTFKFLKLEKDDDGVVDLNTPFYQDILVSDLLSENWKFESREDSAVLEKISKGKSLIEYYGKCYYGIKTGLNEAFITSEFNSSDDNEHLKWVYEGKDLQKWLTGSATKKLIVFKSGWTDEKYSITKIEAALKAAVARNFKDILNHLDRFEKAAKARTDQGKYWWELRNCAYYDLFEKPKIIFPNLQSHNKFAFDSTGTFLNAPAVFLPTDDLFLLTILNSKLIWFYLKRTCVMRSGGYIEVKPQYFEKIPIKDISKAEKKAFIMKAESMLSLHKSISKLSYNFIDLLKANFIFEPTTKLKKWYELEFIDVLTELEKGGAKIPAKKQSEWLELFKQEKGKIKHTQAEISKTDKEIDQLVYKLYNLTAEEIAIVENS